MNATLDTARVSYWQALECQHVLAAANHYQWIRWEQYVIPPLEASDFDSLDRLEAGALSDDLTKRLLLDAEIVIELVRQIVGPFAWPAPVEPLFTRKKDQLIGWIRYARTCDDSAIKRWKLQCRMPFLLLTPQQQASDYAEATTDLFSIEDAGGLVLPDKTPLAQPLSKTRARLRQFRHSAGSHGNYTVSEIPWSRICIACHNHKAFDRM